LLFSLFGALAQYERALTRERVMAGLAAAKRRGRQGGRPPMIDAETLERITAALDGGASKAAVCRTFKVPRSTLLGTLDRVGCPPPGQGLSFATPLPMHLFPHALMSQKSVA
jgi:DNA invertase Pin-like site-specific DNA recombinase